MAETYFCVGECPQCGTGALGVRCCSTCRRPHVLCNQCHALWPTRNTTRAPASIAKPNAPCVQCGRDLRDGATQWATWQELIELDWPAAEADPGAVGEGIPSPRAASDETQRHVGQTDPQRER